MQKGIMHSLRKISGNWLRCVAELAISVRGWLERNKIWFETVAAISLTAVSVLVSLLQLDTARRQEELATIQTKVAEAQHARLEQEDAQIRQEALRDLRLIRRDMLEQILPLMASVTDPRDHSSVGENMSLKEKTEWLDQIGPMWDRLGSNRLVLETPWLFDAYMKCSLDVQVFGNLHNIMPGGTDMLARVPSSFSSIVQEMYLTMSQIQSYCACPRLSPQEGWFTQQREQAIKEGRMRVNPDGSTTVGLAGNNEQESQ